VTLPVVTKERERETHTRWSKKKSKRENYERNVWNGEKREPNETRSKKAGEEREESRTTERRCTDNT
jgi:hypothetical protein